MKKRVFHTELAYVLGLVILAVGTAFMEKADFGMSMVVAPAYLVHLKLQETLPFFTFGMAEYMLQAVLLLVMTLLLRRFRPLYLFSFITAVLYGLTLDGVLWAFSALPAESVALRIVWYLLGMLLCAVGISLFFHTYIAPEAYELFVKELSGKYGINIHRFKTGYDCVSCLVSIVLSFSFFGLWRFEGVKLGTILCALVNGSLIGGCTALLERVWTFKDGLPLRRYFE